MAEDQPEVTIELSKNKRVDKNPSDTHYYTNTPTGTKKITVTKTLYPGSTGDFYKYEHKLERDRNFTLLSIVGDLGQELKLAKVLGNGKREVEGIPLTNNVLSVSAYYWKHDNTGGGQTPGKALLIGVSTSAGTTYYARGSGGTYSKTKLTDDPLERELDDLNCFNNKAATVNIFFSNSETHANNANNKYCCEQHTKYNNDRGKVSVQEKKVSCPDPSHKNLVPITVYKHSIIDPDFQLAGIIFYQSGRTRKSLTASKLNFPIKGPINISAFYCNQQIPKLIYVESNGNPRVKSWFKQRDGNTWEETLPGVPNPEKIKAGDGNFEKLVTALNCQYHNHCITSNLILSSVQGGPAPVVQPQPPPKPEAAGTPVSAEESKPGEVASQESEAKSLVGTLAGGAASIAEYIFSGTLAGTGTAGFLGYKFYTKHKGDPWVRQI